MKKLFKTLLISALIAISAVAFSFSSSAAEDGKWIAAWGSAPLKINTEVLEVVTSLVEVGPVNARTVITPTANGSKVRFLVSNRFGNGPLKINAMTVARSTVKGKIEPNSASPVTFNGRFSVTIPAGREIYTDSVNFSVNAMENIAVSMYIDDVSTVSTIGLSGGTTYLGLGEGDLTKEESMNKLGEGEDLGALLDSILGGGLKLAYDIIDVVPLVVSMDVLSDEQAYSAVVIGDSTVANDFPALLAKSIYEQGVTNVGVVGKGIVGNKIISNGIQNGGLAYADSILSRMNYDALTQSGVEYVIIKAGVNDIVHPVSLDNTEGAIQPTAEQIIAGFKQFFNVCHKKGIKVIAVGITQWKGSKRDYFNNEPQYVRTEAEFQRDWAIAKEVNEWLAETKEHDGFVSFNEISQSPKDPAALDANYTADGVHPTLTLQQLWANYFPTSLLGVGSRTAGVTLSRNELTVYKGESSVLAAEVYPASAHNKNVTWFSSDPSVATVSDTGTVVAIKNGKTEIFCETEEGKFRAKCVVTVRTRAESVVLASSAATIYTTKGMTIKATVLPADASDKTVTFKSSDSSVATVSSKGEVKGVGAGKAVITVSNSAGKYAIFNVTVKKKVQVTAIELNKDSASIYTGNRLVLYSEVMPEKATFKNIKWTSSNNRIAIVDEKGVVVGVSAGKVRITCTSIDNPMVSTTCIVTVKVKTTGVKIPASVTVYTTTSKQLKATVLPATATNKKVTWESENPNIATVDKNGVVKGKKVGTTYVTCTTNNSKKIATCKVTVKKGVLSKKLTLNKTKLSLYDGKTYTLKVTFSPSNTTTKTCSWSSSNKKVATVTSKGVITAVNPGTATITCKAKDTGKTVKCKVTVKAVTPKAIDIEKDYYNVGYKKTVQLKATITPANATDKTITWKSSNPKHAKVSSKGVVTGLKKGTTVTITATTKSGKKVDTCIVRVGDVKVTDVSINKESVVLSKGATLQLSASVYPATATNKKVSWYSSDESVVTVSSGGKIYAVGNGEADITVVTADGGFVAFCTVTVKKIDVTGIGISETRLQLMNGDTEFLVAKIYPSNASDKGVTWESTDRGIATVDSSGKVTAVSSGTCKIRAVTNDGEFTAVCIIIVE